MTLDEMRQVLSLIEYSDYTFEIFENHGCIYLQGRYLEPDIVSGDLTDQHTRKWQLSQHMVKSELVQTALKCALTSAEHRVREHFKYRGQRIFGPHFNVDALYEIAKAKRFDYRGQVHQEDRVG